MLLYEIEKSMKTPVIPTILRAPEGAERRGSRDRRDRRNRRDKRDRRVQEMSVDPDWRVSDDRRQQDGDRRTDTRRS